MKNNSGIPEKSKIFENDKNKPFGALKCADDAVYIETSDLAIDEVIQTTEEAWENNDLYVSGNRVDNQDKD